MSNIDNKIKEFAKKVVNTPDNLKEFNIGNTRSNVNTYNINDTESKEITESIDNNIVLPNSLIVTKDGDTYYTSDGIIAFLISPDEAESALKNKVSNKYSEKVQYLDIYKTVTSYEEYKKIVQ